MQAESLTVKTAGGAGKPADHSMTLVKQRFNEFWRDRSAPGKTAERAFPPFLLHPCPGMDKQRKRAQTGFTGLISGLVRLSRFYPLFYFIADHVLCKKQRVKLYHCSAVTMGNSRRFICKACQVGIIPFSVLAALCFGILDKLLDGIRFPLPDFFPYGTGILPERAVPFSDEITHSVKRFDVLRREYRSGFAGLLVCHYLATPFLRDSSRAKNARCCLCTWPR